MSSSGQLNTNGPESTDRDKGRARAEDRRDMDRGDMDRDKADRDKADRDKADRDKADRDTDRDTDRDHHSKKPLAPRQDKR
ncbi:hypothetical protein BKK80_05490 [Cupriavidus malaysiensis]|uniref:Uncharacterized protein n=2 Tax=Cupriavidus malaysiensis TaxID=367825 RepID=A0ABM6F1W4_9BURK|nr:hypothetical protein BKK80_05490 [Cupriavidus malaysiensis]